jgi:site-specific DNA-methyltransferase (adenine-specific)
MKELPDASVDLVVTSPPYNIGIKYSKYQDTRSWEHYFEWSREWTREVFRVLKPQGSFFLNVGSSSANPLLPHELAITVTKDVGFTLQNTFHWIKSITVKTTEGTEISAGHFKPLQGERYVNDCHEYIFHLTREGNTPLQRRAVGVPYTHKSNIGRWSHTDGVDLRCRGNNWFIPYKTIVSRSKERPHPATFPVELAVFCIKIHGCAPESVVMDPFVGIGHAAVGAMECGIKNFIGFDIDAGYLSVAREALDPPQSELI